MSQPILWPGSGSSPVGKTPFGLYDADTDFIATAPKVADWCATRLGYPTMDVEMNDEQFYACFEEAITEYGHQVNQFNIRENIFALQGRSKDTNLTGVSIESSALPFLTVISADYGTEVGAGGDIDWKTGNIQIVNDQQVYDMQELYGDVEESGNRLEIRRIFHHRTPAVNRAFYFGDHYGANGFLASFGWGAGSGFGIGGMGGLGGGGGGGGGAFGYAGYSYVLHPVFDTLLRTQAVEFADTVYRSAFTFEIINNKLRIFPRPTQDFVLWFEYTVREERLGGGDGPSFTSDVISDYANVPYDNVVYSDVNDVGKRWMWEYALACSQEILGHIRSKYQTVPIPNAEVTLDGPALLDMSKGEKDRLLTQLRETLDESGKAKQYEKEKNNAQAMKDIFAKVPLYIYKG